MSAQTTLFRARVPSDRLKNAEEILGQLGMTPGDAFNMLLAQIELRKWLPFEVTTRQLPMLASDQQAAEWTEGMGAY